MKSSWRKYLLYASLIILGGGLIFILVETVRAKNTGFETKTLWDWMELLIVPFVLAIGAIFINLFDKNRERQIAEDRIKEDRQLADERAKLDREIATDHQQEAALQSYLDRMTELLLEKELRNSINEETPNIANIRTLTVLRGLDNVRKGWVLKFLNDATLINKMKPIVSLENADLAHAELGIANLENTNLKSINLFEANLLLAKLGGADLQDADLTRADFLQANMEKVNLQRAYMYGTNLTVAILDDANLLNADLQNARLEGTSLQRANLQYARLIGANLHDANLNGANLTGADVTEKQLAQAKSMKGAIMPDGTVHD